MTVAEYLDSIKERLLSDPIVTGFRLIRERSTLRDGHLRAQLVLIDGSQLEFSEYVQRSARGEIHVVTYSYHWASPDGTLIMRWDNAPHFPDLPGFPDHIHDGRTGTVDPGIPTDIFTVLDEVSGRLA